MASRIPAEFFNEFSKVVTKHVLDNPEEFNKLKDRLEILECATSKAGAGALGYLMAKAEEEEEEEEEMDVYDQVLGVITDHGGNPWTCTDAIFTIIYEWLKKTYEDNGFLESQHARKILAESFNLYTTTPV